jgi:hypothetical protein
MPPDLRFGDIINGKLEFANTLTLFFIGGLGERFRVDAQSFGGMMNSGMIEVG